MKKVLASFLLTSTLAVIGTNSVFAGAATGGATEVTQVLNNIQLIPTNISTAATALSTNILAAKRNIFDPIANIMIAMSQLSTSKGIINLINGGYQGNSLIPADPRSYADQQGLNAIKIGLSALASRQGGAYSQSLIGALANNFKATPFTTQLQWINTSSIPSTVQSKACDDEMLSNLAKEDVAVEGQPLDQAAYQERKQYFYQQFCVGDPNKDPATARALTALNTARPSIGGWDTWLALTSGDNGYTKLVQSSVLLAQEQDRQKQEAENDLNRGRGLISQKQCLLRATTNYSTGQPYTDPSAAPCIASAVLNPSGLLQDSLTKAANSGLDRLANIQGADSFISLLTSIGNLAAGIRSISNSVSSVINTVNTTVNSVAGTMDSLTGANTSTSNTVSTAPTNDLANNVAQKSAIIEPVEHSLDLQKQALNDLENVDQLILSEISLYENRLNELKDCYDEVSPQDSSAYSFIDNRTGVINDLQGKVNSDAAGIAAARDYIAAMTVKLEAAQSTQEVLDLVNTYQTAAANMPDATTLANRRADYSQAKAQETSDLSGSGQLTQLYNRCVNMRSQVTP